ncbi:MAG: lipid A biosynthesis acyltransferase [Bacteroidaceae bacterium]|nr:lipid A biosynthesis acyltransferase [Bacteroidaceae bacterium]
MSIGKRFKEGTTYGNAWMYRTLIMMLRVVHIRVFYVFMYVCIVPFTLLFSHGARLTHQYYHRRRGYGWWPAWWATYRNHCFFGETVIDKFAMYAGHRFKIAYHGLDLYQQLQASDKALLQLSAHIGCSEVLGYSLRVKKPCNVLVYGGEKQSLMAYRQASFGSSNIRMIPVGTDTSHSEEIIRALDQAETVSAFADRFMNRNKVVTAKIHGYGVKLAKGPFSLATTRGIDVVMASAMKEQDGSYTAFFTLLPYDHTLSQAQQRQQLADAYTAEIERLLERYPLQGFNYSSLWND